MPSAIFKKVVLAARPDGRPNLDNFRLDTGPMPSIPSDGLLLRTLYLSLDPYMRGRMDDRRSYAPALALGDVMPGECVVEVIASNHAEYSRGDIVLAQTGWQSHAISDGRGLRRLDARDAPLTTGLGVLGMPGFTAWSGLTLIGKPRLGETVVVAAATGPVGSLVGQLAKKAGARTVGIAGGPEKCRYLMNDLGFDAAIDHRVSDFRKQLAIACPGGIDVYFENVGGTVWSAVLPHLNRFARVPVCGLISQNGGAGAAEHDQLPATMRAVLTLSLTMRGFINFEFADEHFPTFLRSVTSDVANGTIKYREDVTVGLENAPRAFIGMLQGHNFGKALVDLTDG
ncbi:NADP-dependent oxidoreductase [Beijerinckia sp. L45]|uniref:NADP-dependent oxidoreductase n=1 Tax=Beijerinckia sp. L45 TaxID=1641855 RepID=UPI00131CE8A9|nr:NADP-dependent oxidoreductase [Beijerinckia sp. L45]